MAEPILRWAGGKRQMLDNILSRLPPRNKYETYYEPFFGGGAVFFALEPANGHINDFNKPLMDFYAQYREKMDDILRENKRLDDQIHRYSSEEEKKDFYYTRRREFNELQNGPAKDKFREAVLFLFLNRTCWNGLYRTNEDGDFNVPMKEKLIKTESIENKLRKGKRVLQNTTITADDFTIIEDKVGENDLIFLDPPYVEKSKTEQFDEYGTGGFSMEQQKKVRDLALDFHKRGAYVMITNSTKAEEIYVNHDEFYEHFRILPMKAKRTINSDSSRRIEIGDTDLIVTNSPQFWEQKNFSDFRE